jgi:hypothetical protein
LALLAEHFDEQAEQFPYTYVVPFNPWHYTDEKALITSFFGSVSGALRAQHDGTFAAVAEPLKAVGRFLAAASKGFTFMGMRLDVEQLHAAGEMLVEAGELAKLTDKGEIQLQEEWLRLERSLHTLIDSNGRIVAMVDDVDRLDRSELLHLLRLLRKVADLPGITILVALDEHRVRDVLAGADDEGYGRQYLEKIIQAQLHVPVPDGSVIVKLLMDDISAVLGDVGVSGEDAVPSPYVVDRLSRIVRTPRDVARYVNGFRLMALTRARWDLDLDDALLLAALQVFFPGVFERLRHSRVFATTVPFKRLDPYGIVTLASLEAERRETEAARVTRDRRISWLLAGAEVQPRDDDQSSVASDILLTLFPHLGDKEVPPIPSRQQHARITDPESFTRYFVQGAAIDLRAVAEVVNLLAESTAGKPPSSSSLIVATLRDCARSDERDTLLREITVTLSLADYKAKRNVIGNLALLDSKWEQADRDAVWRQVMSALLSDIKAAELVDTATSLRVMASQKLPDAYLVLSSAVQALPPGTPLPESVNSFADKLLLSHVAVPAGGMSTVRDWELREAVTSAPVDLMPPLLGTLSDHVNSFRASISPFIATIDDRNLSRVQYRLKESLDVILPDDSPAEKIKDVLTQLLQK